MRKIVTPADAHLGQLALAKDFWELYQFPSLRDRLFVVMGMAPADTA